MNDSVIAIIPARSGSKGVIDKNIRCLNGKPLICYTVEQDLACREIDRVIVSTDSEEYRRIAIEAGAEAPFLRPKEIATDAALDIEVFEHALHWLEEHESFLPELCVHLRPTHPIRNIEDISRMIAKIQCEPALDSIRSVCPAKATPYKMWHMQEDGCLSPVATCQVPEAYNAPRQSLPTTYLQNASIDIVRSSTILQKHSMTGDIIGGYVMEDDYDIDTEQDFLKVEKKLFLDSILTSQKTLTICCDIDGIIAQKVVNNNYENAAPIPGNIKIINRYFDMGHRILLFTARGDTTGIDWSETTKNQMARWGVKYTKLMFGKPAADIYIDDRFFDLEQLQNAK